MRLGNSGTTNQDFILELNKQKGNNRQLNLSRDRKNNNPNDILTNHNIDQIYGDNILIVNNDTFGILNKGELTVSNAETDNYFIASGKNNENTSDFNKVQKQGKPGINTHSSPTKIGEYSTCQMMEEQAQELMMQNNVLQESLRAKETR